MILYLFLTLLILATWRGLMRWRQGLFLMILIVAVQDPVRKLVPEAPGYLTLASAPVLVAMIMAVFVTHPHWWQEVRGTFPRVARCLKLLLIACVPAAVLSATYGPGSWMLTVFGAVAYGIIFLAILLGFYFPRSLSDIRQLLSVYCLVTTVMLSGTFIQYFNLLPNSPLIGTQVLDYDWIRYSNNYVVDLIAGFYRSPDVMGWHAATASIFAFILAMTTRGSRRWGWLGLGAVAIVALFLCGRRKMFYQLPVFAIALIWTYWKGGRTSRVLALVGLLLVPVLIFLSVAHWLGPESTYINYYSDHFLDTSDQLQKHGFKALITTVHQSGFFGSGLGVAAPGSHHLNVARPRVWQESGPSRIMVELGVPGFVAMLAAIVSLIAAAWKPVMQHLRAHTPLGSYGAGIFAYFLSNASSLIVSGQILADPFVASFIGISIGLVLSLVRVPVDLYYLNQARVPDPIQALTDCSSSSWQPSKEILY